MYKGGIEFTDGEAVDDTGYEGFVVEERIGKIWKGKKLVMAVGSREVLPDIEGYKENRPENMLVLLFGGVSVIRCYTLLTGCLDRYQCLFCDGHERSHLPSGILNTILILH